MKLLACRLRSISVSLHMGWVFSPYGLVLASSQRGGWVSKVSILTMRERQPSGCCVVYNDRASAAPPREASAHAVGQGNYQGVPWSKGREHRPSSQWRSVNVPWKEEHVGWEIYRCSHLWKMASSSIVSCDSSVVPGLFMEKFMLFPIIWNATSCINQGWEVLFGGVAVYSVDRSISEITSINSFSIFLYFHDINTFEESRPVTSKTVLQFGRTFSLKQRTNCKQLKAKYKENLLAIKKKEQNKI